MKTIFKHKVNYYETDAMGITHHSNYVRWFEEARVAYLDELGYGFKKLEGIGITSPVLNYSCEIKHSTYFDDIVEIYTKIIEYNSVRLKIKYEMKVNDQVVATGETSHCFTNKLGFPIRLNKDCPELDEAFKKAIEKEG